MKMSILMERILTHWLTPITSSPCSRLASYYEQSSSTQHLSSFPSDMASRPTQSCSLTSHAYELALTQPLPPLPQLHLTLGHFHKVANSLTPTMTMVFLDILASQI